MYKSKALQILRSLDRKELDRFKDFVNSPYCNSNTIVTQLLHFLLPFAPNFDHKDLEKKRAYKTLYPQKSIMKPIYANSCQGFINWQKNF